MSNAGTVAELRKQLNQHEGQIAAIAEQLRNVALDLRSDPLVYGRARELLDRALALSHRASDIRAALARIDNKRTA